MLYADEKLDRPRLRKSVSSFWMSIGVDHNKQLLKQEGIVVFEDYTLAMISEKTVLKTPVKVDYVVVSGAPDIDLKDIVKQFKCSKIIIDSSRHWRKFNEWKEEAKSITIPVHFVSEQGAFVLAT